MARVTVLIERVMVRSTAALAYATLCWVERRPRPRVGLTDLRTRPVNDLVELRVGWIDRSGEVGPTWSAFAGCHEVVRVDMFMFPGVAHVHPLMGAAMATGVAGNRYTVPGVDLDEAVASGLTECREHLAYHVAGHLWRRLRRNVPSDTEVSAASAWLASELGDLVRRHA